MKSLLGAGLAGLLALACTTDEIVRQTAIPGTSSGGRIEFHAVRAQYLDVTVTTGGAAYRFFLPRTEACDAIARSEADDVRYRNLALFGRLEVGDLSCDPVGILSLQAWRDRGPRRARTTAIPRDQATYRVYYRDADFALARGRFALTGLIGIPGGIDTVAVVPNDEACAGVLEREVASIEFRSAGKLPFVLVGERGLCPIQGFAQIQAKRDETRTPLAAPRLAGGNQPWGLARSSRS
ncbi:MAG: hypothetical protein MJE66_19590 [Proteobacteria bacterium]|nr:hypothetical protein [Pseudomonadota bacterium]